MNGYKIWLNNFASTFIRNKVLKVIYVTCINLKVADQMKTKGTTWQIHYMQTARVFLQGELSP